MIARDRTLVGLVRECVRAIEPEAQVILYGSRARGDARPDSDWDLLILLLGPVDRQRIRTIRDALFDLGLEHDALFSAVVKSREQWNSPLWRCMPFRVNVMREGIEV